jgi:UDP-N-acetyl-2-amino-2-deoxyglucuronate dehydrogenase
MSQLRFAIIGCGRIAERHAVHIKTVGKLVAVCDIIESKARSFATAHAADYFLSIEELLKAGPAIDVIVICTPNGLHAQHTILALHKRYHVLVEKPMAIASEDCKKMIAMSEQAGRQLFTVMQNRFNPPVAAVKKALDAGAFGKLSSIQLTCYWNRDAAYYEGSWKGTLDLDGGTLYTQFSHFIDLLYWFFGDIKSIHAIAKNAMHPGTVEFEDCGVVLLEFENGIIGTINFSVNSFGKNHEGSLTILGENGTVKIGGEYLNTIGYADFKSYQFEQPAVSKAANDYGSYKGSMSNHDKVYQNLADTLEHGAPFYATAKEGLKTVEIIERIYHAIKQ